MPRNPLMRFLAPIALFRCLSLGLSTQVIYAADPLPGHSVHGEAFDFGPRQAAFLIEGCGKVSFPVTTKNPEAQQFFTQGVGQLHGFWYYEAERSFRQAADLDPDCAMAYWGCSMANGGTEMRAKGFIAEAVKRKDKASPREQAWITATQAFFEFKGTDKKQRDLDFIAALEGIVHDNPDDLEAKAFLAWAIWKAKDSGVTMTSPEAVNALVQQIMAKEPMHPSHHYLIHLWDDKKPARALKSAALCGQSAPAIAHMWHMPGHTFSKLNRLQDAAWQQEAALRVDHAWMQRTQILPDQIHNYAHNTEWLVRTLNQTGQVKEAISIAKNLIEIPRHPKYNAVDKQSNSSGFGRTRLLDTMVRYEMWDDLLAMEESAYLDVTKNPTLEATRLRAVGIAAFFKGDQARLKKALTAVTVLKSQKTPAPTPPPTTTAKPVVAEEKKENVAAEAKKPDDAAKPTPVVAAAEVAKSAPVPAPDPKKPATPGTPATPAQNKDGKPAEKSKQKPKATPAEEAEAELQVLVAIAEKKPVDEVQKLLGKAGDVPKSRLLRYHERMGNKDKVATLANELSDDVPGVALKVQALMDAGKKDDAKKALLKLADRASSADKDLAMVQRMDAIAVESGLPEFWRKALPAKEDSGKRPPMDSLGPLHWRPFRPAHFELSAADGKMTSLKQFSGKPVVLLFYLGNGCGHCMEQLKTFATAAESYRKAGIEIVAIGAESAADLAATSKACDAAKGAPFTLLADPGMTTFRAWRCYDDFEGLGLHGVFLLDDKGNVRWLDVSADPFKDTKFLFGEAQRLLKFPVEDS